MDAFDCIATKLDVREFAKRQVPKQFVDDILEAARLTGTGLNTQHWRFVVVRNNLETLARDSTSGGWIAGADFAVIVLTNPKYKFHQIDAGRVVQDMQLAAWNLGVASGIFTGINEPKLRSDFAIPSDMHISVVVGFGYPTRPITGKKDRFELQEIVYYESYGNKT